MAAMTANNTSKSYTTRDRLLKTHNGTHTAFDLWKGSIDVDLKSASPRHPKSLFQY